MEFPESILKRRDFIHSFLFPADKNVDSTTCVGATILNYVDAHQGWCSRWIEGTWVVDDHGNVLPALGCLYFQISSS